MDLSPRFLSVVGMEMHEDVRQAVLTALESLAAAHEVDIVDVEVAGAAAAPIVRVRIDHADESLPTITLDEVTAETDWISAALDELDPRPGAYTLEVSSPGMDRPLRRVHDFERFAGQQVSLTTTATEGRRRYSGTLGGVADGDVVIADDEGEHRIPFEQVKTAKIKPDYEAGKGKKK